MADTNLYYPDLSGEEPSKQWMQQVRDAVRILYDSIYELGGRKGQQAMFDNQLKVEGDMKVSKRGGGIHIAEAGTANKAGWGRSNASMGVVKLASGTATVKSTLIRDNSRVFLTPQEGTGSGSLTVSARKTGESFDVTSSDGSDARTIAWLIVQPHGAEDTIAQEPKTVSRADDRDEPTYRKEWNRRQNLP